MFQDCRGWGSGHIVRIFFLTLLVAIAVPGIAAPAMVELVSRAPLRRAPDTAWASSWTNDSWDGPSMSTDGRYLAFTSLASNLVPGQIDRNNAPDLFLYDRDAGTITLVSHAVGSAVTACDEGALLPILSANGGFVVFTSKARDLAPLGESPVGSYHLFLFERATGSITLVNRRAGSAEPSNGASGWPRISADGSVIVYSSSATDLLPAPVPEGENIYVYDRITGITKPVIRSATSPSQPDDGTALDFDLSADGRFVAFASEAPDLVPGQIEPSPYPTSDIFLWDRLTGTTTLVSHAVSSARRAGNRESEDPSLSADGGFLAFASAATNLVSGVTDRNQDLDVFLYNRLTGAISLVSRSPAAADITDPAGAYAATISANGNVVGYGRMERTNAIDGYHVLVFDRLAGTTTLVTRSARSASLPADQGAEFNSMVLSANGRYVAFSSFASDLVPGQHESPYGGNVFLLDRTTGSLSIVSHAVGFPARPARGYSSFPVLSGDGRWIAFSSTADNLVTGVKDGVDSTNDVFLWELGAAETRVITLHPPGMASRSPVAESGHAAVSEDGRFVSFVSHATSLAPGFRDGNGASDVFLYDRSTRKTTLVSHSHGVRASANGSSSNPRISRDGNWILYESRATDLVRGQRDEPDTPDVFLYDRTGQRTILVSRSSRSRSRTARGGSVPRGLSSDGSVVVFESPTPELISGQEDRNLEPDVFLWDRRTGGVTLVSRTPESPVRTGFAGASFSSMSPDGNFVAFTSAAWNLVPDDDADPLPDAYLWDRRTGKVEALHPVQGESSRSPIVSADGHHAAFAVTPSQDPDETNELVAHAVFLLDRTTGTFREVASPSPGGWPLGLSEDGQHLLFQSGGEKPPGIADLYLFDRISGETRLVSDTVALPQASRRSVEAQLGQDGRYVAFYSRSPDFGPKEIHNVVLYDRTTGESTLVSRSLLAPGQGGNGHCFDLSMSPTGGLLAFTSHASDLVPRDFNWNPDVFLYSPGEQP